MSYLYNKIDLKQEKDPELSSVTVNEDGKYGVIVSNLGIFITKNYGTEWIKTGAIFNPSPSNVYVDNNNNGQFVAYAIPIDDTYSIYYSENYGEIFKEIYKTESKELILGLTIDATGRYVNFITGIGDGIDTVTYPFINYFWENSITTNTYEISNSGYEINSIDNIMFKHKGLTSSKMGYYTIILCSPSVFIISNNNGSIGSWIEVAPYSYDYFGTDNNISISIYGQFTIIGNTDKSIFISNNYTSDFTEYTVSLIQNNNISTSISSTNYFTTVYTNNSEISSIYSGTYIVKKSDQITFFYTGSPQKHWIDICSSIDSKYIIASTYSDGIYLAEKN